MAFYRASNVGGGVGMVHPFRFSVVQPPVEDLRGFTQLVCGAFDFVGDCFRFG
jgi:hypothetical protein